MDKDNGLVRKGTEAFGKALIKKAQEQNREDLQKLVISRVQELMISIRKQESYIEQCQANIAIFNSRLTAIEKGDFTLSAYGSITYTDSDLNKAITGMVECVNCGANLVKYGR